MLVGKAELTTDTKDTTSAFHKAVIFIRLDSPFSQTEVFNQLRIINHRHLHNWVPCILSIISVPPYEPFNDPNQRLAVLFIAPKQTWERETSPELEDDKMSLSLASKNLLLPISALHHCNKTHTSIDSPFHAKNESQKYSDTDFEDSHLFWHWIVAMLSSLSNFTRSQMRAPPMHPYSVVSAVSKASVKDSGDALSLGESNVLQSQQQSLEHFGSLKP